MGKQDFRCEENVPLIKPAKSNLDLFNSSKGSFENLTEKSFNKSLNFGYLSTGSSSEKLLDEPCFQEIKSSRKNFRLNKYRNSKQNLIKTSSSDLDEIEYQENFKQLTKLKEQSLNENILNSNQFNSINSNSNQFDSNQFSNQSSKKTGRTLVFKSDHLKNTINSNRQSNRNTTNRGMTSYIETLMHLLKGNLGTGILAMPNAFGNSGLLTGSILLPIIGIICVHCMHLLVKAHNSINKRLNTGSIDYEDVAQYSVSLGPKRFRNYSKLFRNIVVLFLLITQLGFCCAYSIFVAETLHSSVKVLTNNKVILSVQFFMLLELPLMIIYCFIRDLKTLSIFSTIANLLQIIGLVIIFINITHDLPPNWDSPKFNGFDKLPLFFGTVVYSFEGIGIVLPLQKEIKEKKNFNGFFGVLNQGMIIVAILYFFMGFFGYLRFGDEIMNYGSITLILPFSFLNETIKLMFALSIFISFALQFYVPINILWPFVSRKFDLESNHKNTFSYELIFRTMLVSLTFLIAAAIPKLDLFISLIGSLSSSSLALIFPPLIELLVNSSNDNIGCKMWTFIIVKNLFIILFGCVGFITGTYISCVQIYKELFV